MIRRKSSHRHYPNPKGPPTPHFVAPRVNELTLGKPERYRSGFGARQHTVERTPVLDPSGREVGDIQRRFTKNRAIDTATSHYATRVGVQGANLAWLGRQETAHQSGDWERTTGANVEETSHHVVADFNELDDLIAHARDELGATHVVVDGAHTKLYFPRGGRYPYEEATVWRKAGYWHAQGPGARTGVLSLPEEARPIGGRPGQRAAEARETDGAQFKKGDRIMWSDSFLSRGKEIDPKWYVLRKNERGTVDWIQRDGDVIVQWDNEHITSVHPPNRLAHATDRMLEEGGLDEAPRRQRRGSDPQAALAKRWMRDAIDQDIQGEFVDKRTGEVNMTKLAEECAFALGHAEWLDDETSPVWDWAFEVAQAFEQGGGAVRESPTDRAPVHIPEAAIEAARKKFLIELRAISPGQPESWYQRQMERQPMFQNPSMYPWQFDLGSTSRSKRSHAVRDYVVIDRHDRTIAGPFKSSSDAHQAAGSAGVVQFVPTKPARTTETRSAHRRPSRRR